MNETTVTTSAHEKAVELHAEIMEHKNAAANALYEMCVCLKKMRDEKLYTELGYSDFGEYAEKKCGIQQRWAYSYIRTLEKLGSDVLQSNANAGITKLELLTHVPELDRAEFIENNDIEDISVAKLKEKIAELEKENAMRGEQISMFEKKLAEAPTETDADLKAQIEELTASNANMKKMVEDMNHNYMSAADSAEKAKAENKKLREQVKELEERPVEVAVAEVSEEDKQQIRADALKEAEIEKKEALKNLRAEMAAAYEKNVAETAEAHERELKALREQVEQAKAVPASAPTAEGDAAVKVKLYFDTLQDTAENLLDELDNIADEERAAKYRKNLKAFAEMIIEAVEE